MSIKFRGFIFATYVHSFLSKAVLKYFCDPSILSRLLNCQNLTVKVGFNFFDDVIYGWSPKKEKGHTNPTSSLTKKGKNELKFGEKIGSNTDTNTFGQYCNWYRIWVSHYRGSPPYAHFGTWKKPCYVLEIHVSGTALWSPNNAKSPTCTNINQKPW